MKKDMINAVLCPVSNMRVPFSIIFIKLPDFLVLDYGENKDQTDKKGNRKAH